MITHAPRWNGVGYVKVEYEGRTYMSDSSIEASFIMKYMHKDKPGEVMRLEFMYKDDIDEFFEVLNSNKKFRKMPSALYQREENSTLYGDDIEKIECRAINSNKPLEIVRMKPQQTEADGETVETTTVYVRRISAEEMLKYMSISVVKYNELVNDSYKLRKIKGYSERLKSLESSEDTDKNDEEVWVEMPGVGMYNRATGEIKQLE